jgi:hypothetical protein
MTSTMTPISLAGSELGDARHVCAFFKSRDDEYRVTLPFIRDGFECGDKAIHIVDTSRRADHVRRMESCGIDTASALRSGQYELYDWSDSFLSEGPFDIDRQLAVLESVLEKARQQGFPRLRYVAHPQWAFEKAGSLDALVEFEARVDQLWPRCADAVVCAYDLARFGADTVVDILRTHQIAIIGGILHQNPFFVPPDEFLSEMRERRAARTAQRSTVD